eukprot:12900837-Ditylum_brightwellii.AAC.1
MPNFDLLSSPVSKPITLKPTLLHPPHQTTAEKRVVTPALQKVVSPSPSHLKPIALKPFPMQPPHQAADKGMIMPTPQRVISPTSPPVFPPQKLFLHPNQTNYLISFCSHHSQKVYFHSW